MSIVNYLLCYLVFCLTAAATACLGYFLLTYYRIKKRNRKGRNL